MVGKRRVCERFSINF
jgi:hypothetical protein